MAWMSLVGHGVQVTVILLKTLYNLPCFLQSEEYTGI